MSYWSSRRNSIPVLISGAQNRLLALACVLLLSGRSFAHDPLTSWTNCFIYADSMRMELTLSPQAASLLVDANAPPYGRPDEEQFQRVVRPALLKEAGKVYRIRVDDTVLEPTGLDVLLTEELDIRFRAEYPRPVGVTLELEATYLESMSPDHTGSIDVYERVAGPIFWDLLDPEHRTVRLPCPGTSGIDESTPPSQGPTVPEADVSVAPPPPAIEPGFLQLLRFGIERILIGYDHLLFLAGILIVCPGLAATVGIVTCFALAHSITLGLAATNVVVLPGTQVELAIAASIVYIGVENLMSHGNPRHRWRLALLFGLIHGFGLAGVFRDLVGGVNVAAPLLAFNLGVEIGQIAIVALCLPILLKLRKRAWFARYVVPTLSVLVTLMGTYWLVTCVVS